MYNTTFCIKCQKCLKYVYKNFIQALLPIKTITYTFYYNLLPFTNNKCQGNRVYDVFDIVYNTLGYIPDQ